MRFLERFALTIFLVAALALAPSPSEAQNCNKNPSHPRCSPGDGGGDGGDGGGTPSNLPPTYGWMHPDVGLAFSDGVTGVGSHVVILDNFGGTVYRGKLTEGKPERRYHGSWVSYTARLVAPGATFVDLQNTSGLVYNSNPSLYHSEISQAFSAGSGVNVVNMSFGLLDPAGTDVTAADYTLGTALWDSLVTGAHAGDAVYVKAAGNEGVAVDGTFSGLLYGIAGNAQDSLNLELINAPGALFVGALDANGTTGNPASIASYSTVAGPNTNIQDMFVVVGVDSSQTQLSGTSFGAPIVAGYAAIIGDKFESATPELVVDRLLQTARTDTIAGYSADVHGRGEASLSGALSPDFVPY